MKSLTVTLKVKQNSNKTCCVKCFVACQVKKKGRLTKPWQLDVSIEMKEKFVIWFSGTAKISTPKRTGNLILKSNKNIIRSTGNNRRVSFY